MCMFFIFVFHYLIFIVHLLVESADSTLSLYAAALARVFCSACNIRRADVLPQIAHVVKKRMKKRDYVAPLHIRSTRLENQKIPKTAISTLAISCGS